MGVGSDVRQGRAYVELYVKNSALVKGLADASKRLREFGTGIATVGKWMMGLGAAIVTPLLAMTRHFASVGSAIYDMSQRTGFGARALSELKYAAEQTGTSLEVVEMAIRRVQRMIGEASSGNKEAKDAFDKLGLSIEYLLSLNPEEQFEVISKRLTSIRDSAAKASVAFKIFGVNWSAVFPMLGDLDALRARASELGNVMSEKDVAAADALGDAFGDLLGAIYGVGNGLSAGFAPAITQFIQAATNAVLQIKQWVAKNAGLIITVTKVAAGVSAAGVAAYAFGKAIAAVGAMVGGVRSVIMWAVGGIELLRLAARTAVVPFTILAASMRTAFGVVSALRIGTMLAAAVHFTMAAALTACSVAVGVYRTVLIGSTVALKALQAAAWLVSTGITAAAAAVSIAEAGMGALLIAGKSLSAGLSTAVSAVTTFFTTWNWGIHILGMVVIAAITPLGLAVGVLSGTISAATVVTEIFTATVTAIRYAVTSAGAAIAALAQSMLTVANLAAMLSSIGAALTVVTATALVVVPAFLLVRTAVRSVLSLFGSMAKTAVKGMKSAGTAAADGAKTIGSAIASGANTALSGLRSVLANAAGMVGQIFQSAVDGFSAAWATLQADIESGWSAISASIAAGDLKSAVKVALAGAMLEWERFNAWMQEMWTKLQPQWNEAVSTAASSIGTLFAEAEIAWGSIWDGLQNGLNSFLKVLDSAMDSVREYIMMTQAFLGNDPAKAIDLRTQAQETREGKRNADLPKWMRDKIANDFDAEADAIENATKWQMKNGPPLQTLVPRSRTPEEKAADDDAARKRGQGVADSISGIFKSPEKPDADQDAARAATQKRIADAEDAFRKAQDDAARAAADAAAAQLKRQQDAEDAAKRRFGNVADPDASQSALTTSVAGTFNARAAMQMGGGDGIQKRIANAVEKSEKHDIAIIKFHEKQLEALRRFTGPVFAQ